MSINLLFQKKNRIYEPCEKIVGEVVIEEDVGSSYNAINVKFTGKVIIHMNTTGFGIIESMYSTLKPMYILEKKLTLHKSGKISEKVERYPFEFEIEPLEDNELYDTFHGLYITVQYDIIAELKRTVKDLFVAKEVIIHVNSAKSIKEELQLFNMTKDNLIYLENPNPKPEFNVSFKLDSIICDISKPLTGTITIKQCDQHISSIVLKLLRVETCGNMESVSKEASEIQALQLCEGNPPKGIELPIHMVFPRLFVCSTVKNRNFKIEFELQFVIIFESKHEATKIIPITLSRGMEQV